MISTIQLFGTPTRRVMDPVHGSIPLFSHEARIIDHPLFQRLRYIFQNDVVFYVFPGCKHDRFLHSIGTMHSVAMIFEKITGAYIAKMHTQTLPLKERNSIKYLYCCLRLAALLHDTGHAPFSHQFEYSQVVKAILNKKSFKTLWKGEDTSLIYKTLPAHIMHEHYSVRIAHQILKEQGTISDLEVDPMDVLFFMETTEIDISERLKECTYDFFSLFFEAQPIEADITPACKSFLTLLKSFISGEIDADKMDYIWRDSYFSGVKYGMFNRDHLLNSFRIGYEDMEFSGNVFNATFSLAILKKGLMALEDFVYARYQLYHELYNHKTVSGFRKILSLAIDEVAEVPEVKKQITVYMQDIAYFKDFTDTFFWEEFRKYALQNPDSYCAMLVRRQPLEYFDLLEDHDEDDVKRKCNAIRKEKGFDLIYWQSKISFSKINNYFKTIKVLTNEFGADSLQLKRIIDVTDFFEKFEKKEIYHLFKLPELK